MLVISLPAAALHVPERSRFASCNLGDLSVGNNQDRLLDDLRRVEQSLTTAGGAFIAAGDLRDVIRQVEVFGFHFAPLDIREHAEVHRHAVAEIYAVLGVRHDYESVAERERVAILCTDIADRRVLIPAEIERFSTRTRQTLETFRMIRSAL